MQIHHAGYRIRGFYRVAHSGHVWGMTSKHAQHRLAILAFSDRHGKIAASEAFKVSIRTLYRWRQTLKHNAGNAAALTPKSCVPHRRRRPLTPPVLSEQIRQLRRQYPNLGKAKLHVLLRDWCAQRRLALPSVSTIGRIIAKDPHKMRHAPARISPTGRLKPLLRTRKTRKPKHCRPPPLALFACDTVMRLRDGIRRYLFTFIDPTSRFAIAFAANSATSRNTTIALEALTDLLPVQPQFLLSDNGSEFMGDFHQRLNQLGIVHWWTYPRSPKMNAHCERFNRTIQEQFVDYHADLLFTDLALFNRKMAAWLVEYNTVIPHHSLGLQTPIQFLFQQLPQCQRYWTHTGLATGWPVALHWRMNPSGTRLPALLPGHRPI